MNATRVQAIAQTLWRGVLRRKDVYVLLILGCGLLLALVSLDIFHLGGIARYVLDAGLLMAWVFAWILAVAVSARELPGEERTGTIYALLAKPITRAELVVGKWLGAFVVVCIATFAFYAIVVGVVLAKGGHVDGATLAQAYVLHAAVIGILAATGLLFSTRMHYDAAASLTFVLTVSSFLVVPRVPEFVAETSGMPAVALLMLYHVLPHFEVFDMRRRLVHEFGPVDGGTFLCVLLYGFLLITALLVLAWWSYRNKRFSRGDLM